MIINSGMLIFCVFDSFIAFFLVFFVTRSKLGGPNKVIARTLATILGILAGTAHLAATIWFNTEAHTISDAGKNVVYAAPIVLSVLMIVLTLLSQPPKKSDEEKEEEEAPKEEDLNTTDSFEK